MYILLLKIRKFIYFLGYRTFACDVSCEVYYAYKPLRKKLLRSIYASACPTGYNGSPSLKRSHNGWSDYLYSFSAHTTKHSSNNGPLVAIQNGNK